MSTGPSYPPPPTQNYIGVYEIGVSPIGTIPIFNWWDTVISQYANSPVLTSWIGSFNAAMDQTQNFDRFYDHIWNVESADNYGLDVWGRIVVAPRIIHIPVGGPWLGFEESNDPTNQVPFGFGIFYGYNNFTNNYRLPDPAYRLCIYAKALTNICDGSIPAINQVLLTLFPGRGDCYCTDGENMTMTYTFNFALTEVEQTIVNTAGFLPKPAGVAASVVINP